MTTTLSGDIKRITYENEETGFRVVKLENVAGHGVVSLVGTFQAVGPGTAVRVTGKFVADAKHGEQFRVETLLLVDPETLDGIEKYLGSGVIAGIGPGYAKRVVQCFGLQTLKVLDEDPGRLAEVPGLGAKRVQSLQENWQAQRSLGSVMMLLQTHGVSPRLAPRIIERFGDKAAAVIQSSPYRLALEVHGVGFKTADSIARALGISGDHPDRVKAGVVHELERLADAGHVLCPRAELAERTAQMLGIGSEHIDAAIDALWASGRCVVEKDAVFLGYLHAAEQSAAELMARLLVSPGHPLDGVERAIAHFQKAMGYQLAEAQLAAVEAVAEHKVVMITGGPGVGKTTIVRAVLTLFEQANLTVRLAAPTGRAARRMSEATGREATTIHRLLEYDPRNGGFQRDVESPIVADAVIVDEMSMVDVQLATALLSAIPSAGRVVMVGDADQLQSVGPGAVLRDILASGSVPIVRLTEIFRQGAQSSIVGNAHSILRGEMPTSDRGDDSNAQFFVIDRREAEHAADTIVDLVVQRIPKRFGVDPRSDIQVLCPMHRGPAGTQAINERLQQELNPQGPALRRRGQLLRTRDKVMQLRNDYERDVYNGDIGTVVTVDPEEGKLVVDFDGRVVTLEGAALDDLTLAYATSIHKSQGSEYPVAIIPLLTAHFVMLSRNLIYTAATRAKRLCVLVADPRALRMGLAQLRQDERRTALAGRLVSAVSKVEEFR